MSNVLSAFETKRRDLQSKLETLLGSSNVYFQPPESFKLRYPAIVYSTAIPDSKYANNRLYMYTNKFSLIYIRQTNTEDKMKEIAQAFPLIKQDRTYVADNLYHTVYDLYY